MHTQVYHYHPTPNPIPNCCPGDDCIAMVIALSHAVCNLCLLTVNDSNTSVASKGEVRYNASLRLIPKLISFGIRTDKLIYIYIYLNSLFTFC